MSQSSSHCDATPLISAFAVLVGGAAGALCRFGGNMVIMDVFGGIFPLGILCVNILGAFCMGLLQGGIRRSGSPHAVAYALLGVGFLGGFTTFSTFALDTFTLYSSGHPLYAMTNVILNACLCVIAAGVGYSAMLRGRTRASQD